MLNFDKDGVLREKRSYRRRIR